MKKIAIGKRPIAAGEPPASGDAWVSSQSNGDPADSAEPLKRLTFDVPLSLHTAIKIDCARRGVKIGHEVMALLEAKWGNKKVIPQ